MATRVERGLAGAGEPVVRDLRLVVGDELHDAVVHREAVELAVDVELTLHHRVARGAMLRRAALARFLESQLVEAVHLVDVRYGHAAVRGEVPGRRALPAALGEVHGVLPHVGHDVALATIR